MLNQVFPLSIWFTKPFNWGIKKPKWLFWIGYWWFSHCLASSIYWKQKKQWNIKIVILCKEDSYFHKTLYMNKISASSHLEDNKISRHQWALRITINCYIYIKKNIQSKNVLNFCITVKIKKKNKWFFPAL